MPNISKINALAIGSVAKVDGLATSSILDINGVTVDSGINPTAPTSGFLFTYSGGAAAYSVRQLNNNAAQIMRVRRASDNVEADVGFDAGELKLTSPISNTSDALSYTDFADFVDHTGTPTNAFGRYWYDQTGLQNHAGQSTAGSQPQIYDATTGLITENGKPAVQTTGAFLELASAVSSIVDAFTVARETGTDTLSYLIKSTGDVSIRSASQAYRLVTISSGDWANAATAVYYNGSIPSSNPSSTIQALVYVGGGSRDFLQISTDFTGGGATRDWEGNIQEIVLYDVDQSGNRTGIESNINGFYSIYP